jgi:hypothetical protein
MTTHAALQTGPLLSFDSWPPSETDLPRVAAGVYAIYKGSRLYYVGMAGKSLTPELIESAEPNKSKGLRQRLEAHRSGRRSGDQFCVYVADHEIIPNLTPAQQSAIGRRELHVDHLVRDFIRAEQTRPRDDSRRSCDLITSVPSAAL